MEDQQMSQKKFKKISKQNFKLIIEKDENMYQAIDKGIRIANGEIISWINSDDLYFPKAIENAVKHFKI